MTTEQLAKFEELCNKLNQLHKEDGYNVALFYCHKITKGKTTKEFQLYSEDDDAIKDNFLCCATLEEVEAVIDNLLCVDDDTDDDDDGDHDTNDTDYDNIITIN